MLYFKNIKIIILKDRNIKYSSEFIKKFQTFNNKEKLFQSGDRILLAVSGGVDSIVLYHVFNTIRNDENIKLGVAHFNHGLRGGEADKDQQFVQKL